MASRQSGWGIVVGLILGMGTTLPSWAQVEGLQPLPPPDEDSLQPLETEPPVLPPSDQLPEPEQPEQPVEPTGETVTLSDIQVLGSTVFAPADFEPILAPYLNRPISLAELQTAADEITQLYLEAGYLTSRAVLPDQTIEEGRVQIQVVEGRLAEIQVEGTDRLQAYVRDRITIATQPPLRQDALENQLRRLRADPLFDNLEASLRAGEGVGESVLVVRVEEAPAFVADLRLDTYSPPSVGQIRLGSQLRYRNPTGVGDELSATAYRTTTGGSSIYDLTYRRPLNPQDGTLQLRYAPNFFELTDPGLPFTALGVTGDARVYEVSYRQPISRSLQEEFALSVGFHHRVGETLISNFIADSSRTSVFQFGQDYLRRDPQGAWVVRSQFSLGTGLLNATIRPDPQPDGQFLSWLGQVQRVQRLGDDHLLTVQGALQFASEPLLGSERFTLGGGQSVRGYPQNARSGDSGLRLSIEDRITVLRDEGGNPALQLAPFVDAGWVWFQDANSQPTQNNALLSTGIGALFSPLPNFDVRLDLGFPLIELTEPGDRQDGPRLDLNLIYRL